MDAYNVLHETLVSLFNDIMELEEKAIITEKYKNITNNDMHIIEAIGMKAAENMSSVAKKLKVTVGTLTIAINNLVKKGYVNRVRSTKDKRVVLISLSEKGEEAYLHHKKFHEEMIAAIMEGLDHKETDALVHALTKLNTFFRTYQSE